MSPQAELKLSDTRPLYQIWYYYQINLMCNYNGCHCGSFILLKLSPDLLNLSEYHTKNPLMRMKRGCSNAAMHWTYFPVKSLTCYIFENIIEIKFRISNCCQTFIAVITVGINPRNEYILSSVGSIYIKDKWHLTSCLLRDFLFLF